jgi:hypothetical protein
LRGMPLPQTSAKTRTRFDAVAEALAPEGVVVSKMFGMPSLQAKGGKAIAGLWGDSLVVKLPPADLQAAMELQGARVFDPMGGRPMKGWVVVPGAHARRWAELAQIALAYVAGA